MNQNYWDNPKSSGKSVVQTVETGLQQFMTQTFTWMALGLAITGVLAVLTVSNRMLMGIVFGTPFVFFGLIIAELALVFWFSTSLQRGASAQKLLVMFLAYSALNGLTISSILLVYTYQSVAQTFFITAGMFGGVALYGYVTKKDLTGAGQFMRMGIWGIILAMVVNFFLKSTMLELMISVIGVAVFTVLTAYDTQKLKAYYAHYAHDGEGLKRVSLGGALTLYLDFINLFLFLLRLLGGRRR